MALAEGRSGRWLADQRGHADPALTSRLGADAMRDEETDLSFAGFGGFGRPATALGLNEESEEARDQLRRMGLGLKPSATSAERYH
jgi:hypothetical protein